MIDLICGDDDEDEDTKKQDETETDDEDRNNHTCSLYVTINNRGSETLEYSLNIWSSDYAIQLYEGHQQQYKLSHFKHYMNFYFRPTNNEHSITFNIQSLYGKTGFNLLIYHNKLNRHKLKWPFPDHDSDKFDTDYQSGLHNTHSKTFQTSAFDECWPDCVVLVSVYHEDDVSDELTPVEQALDEDSQYQDEFTIMVSSVFTQVTNGQKVEFSVIEKEGR